MFSFYWIIVLKLLVCFYAGKKLRKFRVCSIFEGGSFPSKLWPLCGFFIVKCISLSFLDILWIFFAFFFVLHFLNKFRLHFSSKVAFISNFLLWIFVFLTKDTLQLLMMLRVMTVILTCLILRQPPICVTLLHVSFLSFLNNHL